MNRSLARSERFKRLEMLLLSHPEGLSRAGIARRLGVSKPTPGLSGGLLRSSIPQSRMTIREIMESS